jgi:hypothetical protein
MSTATNIPLDQRESLSNGEVLYKSRTAWQRFEKIWEKCAEPSRSWKTPAKPTTKDWQLIKAQTATDAALPTLKHTLDRNSADLNGLGKIAHSAKFFGNIALVLIGSVVGLAFSIVTFLYHHLVFK